MTILLSMLIFKIIGMKRIKFFAEYYGGFTLMCATVISMIILITYMCVTHGYHNPIAS